MPRIEDILQQMMRRFDASDEHANELRGDLGNIRKKVNAHVISIKHLELQMSQFSTIVNPRKPGTLPRNTIQNPKNDGHCMAVSTRGGKKTIDPHMLSVVEDVMRKDAEVVEISGKLVYKMVKEAKVPQKVLLIPRLPPPFP